MAEIPSRCGNTTRFVSPVAEKPKVSNEAGSSSSSSASSSSSSSKWSLVGVVFALSTPASKLALCQARVKDI